MRAARLLILGAALAGIILGLGAFTFIYGKGYSYLLDDPGACVNCHVMRDNYDAWTAAPHRGVTCNQCHVPHGLGKYLAEVTNGWRHSFAFTFQDVQVIRITPTNRRILAANCRGCHALLVAETFPGAHPERHCFDCHAGTGHGF